MQTNRKLGTGAALMVLLLAPVAAPAQSALPEGIDGVLSLTPVGTASYIAVELAVRPSMSVTGLRWVHNDATSVFPRVLVVGEGDEGKPDLSDIRAEVTSAEGGNLAWAELALPDAVACGVGRLFAVFQLPAFEERTGDGLGGGGGLGYRNVPGGAAAFLSLDGVEWVHVSSRISLAVEAVVSAATGGVGTLSKGAGAIAQEPAPAAPAAVTALQAVDAESVGGALVVRFSLAHPGQAVIEVYNVRGQRVRTLTRDILPAGAHVIHWNGDDERGAPIASGTYIVRMEALGQSFHRKLTVVR